MRARAFLVLPAVIALSASCSSSSSTDGAETANERGADSGAGQSASGTPSGATDSGAAAVAEAGASAGSSGGTRFDSGTGSDGGNASSGAGSDSGAGASGSASSEGGADGADGGGVDCTATFPSGGNTLTGTNVNGAADGLNYGIWTNGSGGSITVFPNAHAFSASWNDSMDFLAHLGLDFNGSKSTTAYGTITAQFVESKTGTSGSFSSIGVYGWMHSPCIEWYINEDSFTGLYQPKGAATATIDGATYSMTTSMTTGTGGANACEAGHTGGWINMTSTRSTARQCGAVTVSDHFKAWAAQGWTLGNLASVHINMEVGGGSGSIQFSTANVTTSSN